MLIIDLLRNAAESESGVRYLDKGWSEATTYLSYSQLYHQAKVREVPASEGVLS